MFIYIFFILNIAFTLFQRHFDLDSVLGEMLKKEDGDEEEPYPLQPHHIQALRVSLPLHRKGGSRPKMIEINNP